MNNNDLTPPAFVPQHVVTRWYRAPELMLQQPHCHGGLLTSGVAEGQRPRLLLQQSARHQPPKGFACSNWAHTGRLFPERVQAHRGQTRHGRFGEIRGRNAIGHSGKSIESRRALQGHGPVDKPRA